MLFWIMTAALVALVAALFVLALTRRTAGATPGAAYDVQVYRDQLAEIEKDAARGVIGADEAERAKLEISRRMLEADRAAQNGPETTRAPQGALVAALLVVAAAMGGTFVLYQRLGAPGYEDLPVSSRLAMADEIYESRPSQDEAEKEAAAKRADGPQPEADPQVDALMERLRQAVADRPNEIRGLELLARNEAAVGNFRAGWETQRRLIAVKGEAAEAEDYAALGELQVVAAGGLVTEEAEKAFATALEKDPKNGLALYYLGLMMAQNARGDRAFDIWDTLLRLSKADDPWVPMIMANIGELAWIAGERNYTPPEPQAAAPSVADLQAAARAPMPEAREALLSPKLEALNAKMADQGGSAEDWAKLIAGLKLIGQGERAKAVWAEAQKVFAEHPEMLEAVRLAAEEGWPGTGDGAEAPGPTAEQVEAAQDMTAEERQEMILGMVNGLVDRLETEGGSGAEWGRAVSSLATLGQAERAAEIFAKAKAALAESPDELALVREAAAGAGVGE
ncbi:MAG: c-type cytochrome biogenesis protein CcmI [Paracoccaceae bacterium]|jgi:cytochrome c-type biogenesis protein CcmH